MKGHPDNSADVTRILRQWHDDDRDAASRLMLLVNEELRARASDHFRREHHSLQATALVHQAYLKLAIEDQITWKNRAHFCAVAATLIRRILVQHARDRDTQKCSDREAKFSVNETRGIHQEG